MNKKIKLGIPIMLSMALLVGCNNTEEKTDTSINIHNKVQENLDVPNNKNFIMDLEYKKFSDVKKQLSSIVYFKNQNTVENVFYSGLYANQIDVVDKSDLNRLLLQTKVDLEADNKKYTQKIKDEMSYKYIIKYGLENLLVDTFPVSTKEMSQTNYSDLAIQFVSYNISKEDFDKAKKPEKFYLDKLNKDLEKVNKMADLNNVPSEYSLLNYSKMNPLVSADNWKSLYDNKDKKMFSILDSENVYHFVKILSTDKITPDEKSVIISLEKYLAFLSENTPKKAVMSLIKTLDFNSNDFDLTEDSYEELEKEIDKLDEVDVKTLAEILTKPYVSNYMVIK